MTACVSESPWMWGGSVDVRVWVNGIIDKFVIQNQKNCGVTGGLGSNAFTASCKCSGNCNLMGSW